MTPGEARCLLAARRPNGADDADPAIAEALAVLRQHPESAAWVRAEQDLDQQVVAQLRRVMPPPDLKERLLAGRPKAYDPDSTIGMMPLVAGHSPNFAAHPAHVSADNHSNHPPHHSHHSPATASPRETAPRPRPSPTPTFRLPWGLIGGLVAAAAAIVMTVAVVQSRTRAAAIAAESSVQTFQQFVADYMSNGWDKTFDLPSGDYRRVSGWLAAQPGAVAFEPPAALAQMGTLGCRVFDWKDRKVTLISFRVGSNETALHVLGINRDELSDAPTTQQVGTVGEWNSTTWTQGSITYVALTKLDPNSLRRLF